MDWNSPFSNPCGQPSFCENSKKGVALETPNLPAKCLSYSPRKFRRKYHSCWPKISVTVHKMASEVCLSLAPKSQKIVSQDGRRFQHLSLQFLPQISPKITEERSALIHAKFPPEAASDLHRNQRWIHHYLSNKNDKDLHIYMCFLAPKGRDPSCP